MVIATRKRSGAREEDDSSLIQSSEEREVLVFGNSPPTDMKTLLNSRFPTRPITASTTTSIPKHNSSDMQMDEMPHAEPQFIFDQIRQGQQWRSCKEIKEHILQHWEIYPVTLRPHILHLIENMHQKGIPWANAIFDALHITSDIPPAVAQQHIDEYDRLMRRQTFTRGFRGRRGGFRRGSRGRAEASSNPTSSSSSTDKKNF